MLPLFFIVSPCIGNIADCLVHLILCQLFHHSIQLRINGAPLQVAVDGIEPPFINLFQRMIVRQLPLLPAFQIADLSACPAEFIPRCQITTV